MVDPTTPIPADVTDTGETAYDASAITVDNPAAAATINSKVSLLAATATVTVNNLSNSLTINGAISGTALTKSGDGTLVLGGANTYTGLTTVGAGTLSIANSLGLGTVAGGTTVTAGAALELQGGVNIGGEALTLNGAGISGGGALRNLSGNNIRRLLWEQRADAPQGDPA